MDHAAIPVTMAPNANKGAFLDSALLKQSCTSFSSMLSGGPGHKLTRWCSARSSGVGIVAMIRILCSKSGVRRWMWASDALEKRSKNDRYSILSLVGPRQQSMSGYLSSSIEFTFRHSTTPQRSSLHHSVCRQACDSPPAARAHKRTHNISVFGIANLDRTTIHSLRKDPPTSRNHAVRSLRYQAVH